MCASARDAEPGESAMERKTKEKPEDSGGHFTYNETGVRKRRGRENSSVNLWSGEILELGL